MLNSKRKILAIALVITSVCTLTVGAFYQPKADKDNTEYHDVVVVGAGISGLTCGYYLQDEGEDFVVLEKENQVGGRTLSGNHASLSYAKGTEYLGEPDTELDDLIYDLGLKVKEIPSPMDGYFDGNKFYYGYEGMRRYLVTNSDNAAYKSFVKLILNEYKKYKDVPEAVYNERVKALDNISAAQWLRDNNIPEVFIKKYNVSSKGLFGATLDEISALSFIPEAGFDFSDLSSFDINSNANYKDFDENDFKEEYAEAKDEDSGSYSFTTGITELTNKLHSVLSKKVRLNSNVTSVTKKGLDYETKYIDESGKEHTIISEKIVLAVPAPIALKIAPTVLTKEKTEILSTVKYSSYATVALFSKKPIFDKAFDLAVPDGYYFTDIYDSTWIEKHYDKNKKNLNDYIASVYIAPTNSSDHSLDTVSDDEIIKNVYKDLDKVFESASSQITGYDIQRFPYAYPVMSLGAYDRLIKLNKLNKGSLILAGDYMIYPTFEAAVESGHIAADKIIDGKWRK